MKEIDSNEPSVVGTSTQRSFLTTKQRMLEFQNILTAVSNPNTVKSMNGSSDGNVDFVTSVLKRIYNCVIHIQENVHPSQACPSNCRAFPERPSHAFRRKER